MDVDSDVSKLEYPELTNVAKCYLPFALVVTFSTAEALPSLYSAIIMKESVGKLKQEIQLAFPDPSSHNECMQNKNETNYTVKQLTDKLVELGEATYPNDSSAKWAYTVGTLQAILDFEVKGYAKGISTLQERINEAYERYDQELQHELELAASRD